MTQLPLATITPSRPRRPRHGHRWRKQRAAHHEAGHAAALLALPGQFFSLRGISLWPYSPAGERHLDPGGHVTIDPPARPRLLWEPEQRQRAETLLVVVLCGVVAERAFLGQRQRERAFAKELATGCTRSCTSTAASAWPSTGAGCRPGRCGWCLATGGASGAWLLPWLNGRISAARRQNGCCVGAGSMIVAPVVCPKVVPTRQQVGRNSVLPCLPRHADSPTPRSYRMSGGRETR